jgi:hypothetical protein
MNLKIVNILTALISISILLFIFSKQAYIFVSCIGKTGFDYAVCETNAEQKIYQRYNSPDKSSEDIAIYSLIAIAIISFLINLKTIIFIVFRQGKGVVNAAKGGIKEADDSKK